MQLLSESTPTFLRYHQSARQFKKEKCIRKKQETHKPEDSQEEMLDSYRPQIKEFSNAVFIINTVNLLKETNDIVRWSRNVK